jgi:outer membrane protein, multidrug efflux system
VKNAITLLLLIIFSTGCAVGPNYRRPKADVPGAYRGTPSLEPPESQQSSSQETSAPRGASPKGSQVASSTSQQASVPAEESFGDQKWWEVFQDPELQQLIRTALNNNYDVRIAATRILEAQAQLGVTRADQLPTISAGAAALNQRLPKTVLNPEVETNANAVSASMVWDLDFWGKYRRATEAARANLLATEWARRAVTGTLVSNVAASYFASSAESVGGLGFGESS